MSQTDTIRVLIIDDDAEDRRAIERLVRRQSLPYQLTMTDGYRNGIGALADKPFDVILLDNELGDGAGLDMLPQIEKTPVIFITGTGSEKVAVKAMRAGAYDYLVKDSYNAYLEMLPDIIANVLKRRHDEEEKERLFHELQEALATIKTLRGLIPICSSCKKVRDDDGYWRQIETYLSEHSDAEFSHGYCPECYERVLKSMEESSSRQE